MIIQDQAGLLSTDAITRLQDIGYSFNPRIIILNKSPDNLGDYVHNVNLQPDQIIMVVDVPGHNVRTVGGSELTDKGVDGPFLKRMQDTCFVPQMKKKNFEGAIKKSMDFIQTKVATSQAVEEVNSQPLINPSAQPITVINQAPAQSANVDFNPWLGGGLFIFAAIVVALFVIFKQNTKFKIKEFEDSFQDTLRSITYISQSLEGISIDNNSPKEIDEWFISSKELVDDHDSYRVSKISNQDKLLVIASLSARATEILSKGRSIQNSYPQKVRNQRGGFISNTAMIHPNTSDKPKTPTPPSGGSNVTKPEPKRSSRNTNVEKNYNPHNNYTNISPIIIDNSNYSSGSSRSSNTYNDGNDDDDSSSSSSSSWGSSSSSDSGSSSWGSSSSSDSGSSSSSDSGSSDSGSSGW